MSTRRTILVAALCATTPLLAQAQEMKPARILQIGYEQVKFGKSAAHEKNETSWPMAFGAAKTQNYYFALTPMSGAGDVLYVSGYQSFEDLEKTNEAVGKVPGLTAKLDAAYERDGEFVNSARTVIAAINSDATVGPVPDFPNVRGWRITTYRLRIGQTDEFTEARKLIRAAYEKAGIAGSRGVFQVVNGVNTPTFMVFRPFVSLAEFDADSAMNARIQASYAPGDFEKVQKLNEGAILTSESNIYTVSPKQSYVPASYASISFWKTNPVFAAAAQKSTVTQAGEKKKP